MILGFKQQFPWSTKKNPAPTNFREKILAGVGMVNIHSKAPTSVGVLEDNFSLTGNSIYKPKIHTMREDPHNRWRAGRSIQMVYRGPKYSILDHFNKGIPELEKCKSVQKVEIKWIKPEIPTGAEVIIDGRFLSYDEIDTLAINDGFNSIEDFFRWFRNNWSGYILHWTDFRY